MSTPPKQTQPQTPEDKPKWCSTRSATVPTTSSSVDAGISLIIHEGTSVQEFVERVFDKLEVPASQHQQRSTVCKTLEKDMYFTVGALRSAKLDEAQWVTYATNKKFSDGFTKIAAQFLYPSSYQRLGLLLLFSYSVLRSVIVANNNLF